MPDNVTTTTTHDSGALLDKSDLVSQTSHGPTLGDVASHVLSEALESLYPELCINPDQCMIGIPQWLEVQGQLTLDATRFESLSHVLVHLSLSGKSANYIAGEHFLTAEPQFETPLHLAVDIEEIGALLNNYAPLLFVEFQARQLDFWNQTGKHIPRWQELSDSLRHALNVQQVKGWSADECALAEHVFNTPDKAQRLAVDSDFTDLQACLIDIDTLDNGVARHLMLGGALVLRARHEQRELLVMYTIERGHESFSSLEQLGASLPSRIAEQLAGRAMQWRLFEPDGNIFDHMAWALVATQLDAIDALRFMEEPGIPTITPVKAPPADTPEHSRLNTLETAIPNWLRSARAVDITAYSQYVTRLGKLYRRPAYKSARDKIPSITQYAQRLMREAIIKDKQAEGAADLPLDDLEITITNSFTAGDLTLPNALDRHTETLADFALENAAPYLASLRFRNGATVPDWLTTDLLLQMSRQVNIGKVYPELIKRKLIDDPVESRRQAQLYGKQLRVLLPLAALECKVKGENGIDETGCRYIFQLMSETADGAQDVVICPLALTPQHRLFSTQDTVTNMYIIGPRNPDSGPCLLYRPLFDRPLLQFPSRQNLLYALHQPGELRDSVLAWLPDKTLSFEYAQYVFPVGLPSPWLVTQQLIDPLVRLDGLGRVSFGNDELNGERFQTLFDRQALAIVELADRQSQSNAEQRWALLRDTSWTLFNIASNFLSGAVGTAVWVWQSIEGIQQALDAHERGDSFVEWTSLGDVLLALGIILTHHAVMRRQAVAGKPKQPHHAIEETNKPVADPVSVTRDPTPLLAELPPSHYSSIAVAGSVPRRASSALGAYLDTLKVTAPDLASEDLSKINGTPPHLYQLGDKTYAQVDERWFEVSVDDDEQVTIHSPDDPARSGPSLVRGRQGLWYLDLRLRLRGGGPKGRLKALIQAKALRKHQLEEELKAFEDREKLKKEELAAARSNIMSAPPEAYDNMAQLYGEKLEALIREYQQALEHLQEWRTQGGTTGYVYDTLRLTTEMQKHLALWFVINVQKYTEITQVLVQDLPDGQVIERQIYVDASNQATALGQLMVEKLTLSHTSLDNLKALGKTGITKASEMKKLLPTVTLLDFKANEIGMSHEPCMQEQASPLMEQAREEVGRIIVNAAMAGQEIAALMKATSVPPDPVSALENLSRLIDTFVDADQRIQELPETFPDLVNRTRLMHLRTLIEEFRQVAQTQLDSLLLNNPTLITPDAPPPARPGPSRLAIKVSKSRPRDPADSEIPAATQDPVKAVMPKPHAQPTLTLNNIGIIDNGLELNLDFQSFIERTRKDALRPSRIPADMQEIFDQYALKLEQSASSVDQAMLWIRDSGETPPPVADLSKELREAAITVRRVGVSTRASLYKVRKPTQSSFTWMHKNDQLHLTRNTQGRIQTKQLGDYFQEYRILDKTNKDQPLWVAHFHYKTAESPSDQPATAHLKLADSYLEGLTPEQRHTLTTVEPIDGVLRKLTDPTLRKLFLDLEPQNKPSGPETGGTSDV